MDLCASGVFEDFPGLRLIIPHGGGAVPCATTSSVTSELAEFDIATVYEPPTTA